METMPVPIVTLNHLLFGETLSQWRPELPVSD